MVDIRSLITQEATFESVGELENTPHTVTQFRPEEVCSSCNSLSGFD